MKIKICGITNIDDAIYSINKGANFIGVVLDYNVKRHGTEDLIREIKNNSPETDVVGVYTEFPDNDINEDYIQLHFPHNKNDIKYIKNKLNKHVISVININTEDYKNKINEYMEAGSDYILLEDRNGIYRDRNIFNGINKYHIGLAGKISSGNVKNVLEMDPELIDVSSSLEEYTGKKSFKKIDGFFKNIGDYNAIKQYK